MNNFDRAKQIISILGIKKDNPWILKGLTEACADCKHYGPPEGKPCMSLRLALDMGVEYTTPEWCRDKQEILN